MHDAPYPCRYLKLPMSFDTARIEAELDALLRPQWVGHMNTGYYEGGWRCLALRSMDGDAQNIQVIPDAEFRDTEALGQCDYLREVLDSFACDKTSVRLMALDAGGVIKPHRDRGGAFEDGLARLHIPLRTQAAVTFCIDDDEVHFSRGDTWYLNADCTHAVYNRSPDTRIHLMLDCPVNPWLQQLFDSSGFVPRAPAPYGDPAINDDNVLDIIANLRTAGSAGALQLAQRLEDTHRDR